MIRSILARGDEVIVHAGHRVKDGVRVRQR
jgi:hypothetical protein